VKSEDTPLDFDKIIPYPKEFSDMDKIASDWEKNRTTESQLFILTPLGHRLNLLLLNCGKNSLMRISTDFTVKTVCRFAVTFNR